MPLPRTPRLRWSLAAFLCMLPLPALAAVQKKGAAKPVLRPFVGKIEDAKRAALERNVPLLIHVILEGEEQNDEYRAGILPDAGLIGECERAVVIVSNNGEHAQGKVTEVLEGRTTERQACSAYTAFERCEQHRATWDPLYFEFHDPDGQMRCPQTILLDPRGLVAWRHNVANPPPVADVIAALKQARAAAGNGLTDAELALVKGQLEKGRLAAAAEDWPRAWQAWHGVLELLQAGPLGEEAGAGNERALSGMRALLAAAQALLVPGSAGAGWRMLRELATAFAGTPLEKEVQAAIQGAERDKRIRGEVEAAKLALEAEELWVESQRLFQEGDERKGERAVRRLLRPKYRETEAGKRAREKYPEWAAEEDAKGKT